MSGLFDKIHGSVHQLGSTVKDKLSSLGEKHSHTHPSGECAHGFHEAHAENRFMSFAPQREGNETKWYVDACGYMWAVSVALEEARESIWILDWWLSPELFLRRPPAVNEQYRLDNLLKAAAERGVQVKVIVYKEVTQALTLSSWHTKHHLEDLHPNIAVIRHPDHLPDQKSVGSSLSNAFKNLKVTAASASQLPTDTLKAIYGVAEDSILYWAHHEKLCLVDGKIAFMGGLDLCYGRWDTNHHSIADAHPGDINEIVFAGQDYNNSRIMDFQDVQHWQNNKLDRTQNSRMGWSDISLSLRGEVVEDLIEHFVQRWNFIFDAKMESRNDAKYAKLVHQTSLGGYGQPSEAEDEHFGEEVKHHFKDEMHRLESKFDQHRINVEHQVSEPTQETYGSMACQIVRSCARWSHGVPLEHSIANAYIDVIKNSEHFVYIENQFFITATDEKQKPISNMIGAAITERIIRAAREGQNYKMIVLMPAIPAFAGDLRGDDALSTRAIMEFQYNSICRGGYSIYEKIAQAGYSPLDYIRFYNLRNYDRINASGAMAATEQQAGVPYEEARKQFDDKYGGGYTDTTGKGYGDAPQYEQGAAEKYQQAAQQVGDKQGLGSGRWDSVAECYMLNGEDIRNVPWEEGNVAEIDAFVTEELYIHSKLLIADDRVIICGSANLNDRSQLGNHDSEMAVLISGPGDLPTTLNTQPFTANRFVSSLRRQIFRKHLGLLPPQDYKRPDANFLPVSAGPNAYDWDSPEDRLVAHPLDPAFLDRWNETARTNTEVLGRVFHPVPHDAVKSWAQYDEWYEKMFRAADPKDQSKPAGPYKVGHVVREEFPGGVQEVKELLSKVRGTLVEMPLMFLKEEDIAKEGLGLNAFTEEVYT